MVTRSLALVGVWLALLALVAATEPTADAKKKTDKPAETVAVSGGGKPTLPADWTCFVEVWGHPYPQPGFQHSDHTAVAYVRKVPGQDGKYAVQFYCNHGTCPGELSWRKPFEEKGIDVSGGAPTKEFDANPMEMVATYVRNDDKCPDYLFTCDMLRAKDGLHFVYSEQRHVCNTDSTAEIWSFIKGFKDPVNVLNSDATLRKQAYRMCTNAVSNWQVIDELIAAVEKQPIPDEGKQVKADKEKDKKVKADDVKAKEKEVKADTPKNDEQKDEPPEVVLEELAPFVHRVIDGKVQEFKWVDPLPRPPQRQEGTAPIIKATKPKKDDLKRRGTDSSITPTKEQKRRATEPADLKKVTSSSSTDEVRRKTEPATGSAPLETQYDCGWCDNCVLPSVYNCWGKDAEPQLEIDEIEEGEVVWLVWNSGTKDKPVYQRYLSLTSPDLGGHWTEFKVVVKSGMLPNWLTKEGKMIRSGKLYPPPEEPMFCPKVEYPIHVVSSQFHIFHQPARVLPDVFANNFTPLPSGRTYPPRDYHDLYGVVSEKTFKAWKAKSEVRATAYKEQAKVENKLAKQDEKNQKKEKADAEKGEKQPLLPKGQDKLVQEKKEKEKKDGKSGTG